MPASAAAAISARPIAFGSSYGLAAAAVVEVVELADRRDAGQRHLGEGRAREREVAVRIEPLGERVHLLAPGPERAAAVLGAPAQGALEGVRVGVGEPGQREPVEPPCAGRRRRRAARHRRDPAVLDLDHHAGLAPRRRRARRARTSSVVTTPTRSDEPARALHELVAVEALELLPGGERARVADPVEEQDAVEVVELVLERAGGEAAPDLVVLDPVAVEVAHAGSFTWRGTSPRRFGTDRQPSLICTTSSSTGSITGLTITVSGIGGLYG